MRLPCDSINVRERPWASKRQPIDYKRCCTDRLNPQPESERWSGHCGTSAWCHNQTRAQRFATLFFGPPAYLVLRASSRAFAVAPYEGGFWPVISNPSVTTWTP